MNKHGKQIRLNAVSDAAQRPEIAPLTAEAESIATEILVPRPEGAKALSGAAQLRRMGFGGMASFVEETAARTIIRPSTTTLALAQVREGFGPGFFDEVEDLKVGSDVQITQATAPVFRQLLGQYGAGTLVLVRPGTPFFDPGAWVPEPRDPAEGPAIPRPGCRPLRITNHVVIGGGWVWVRPRPGGGIQGLRFPFHRAAINAVSAVPGAVFSHKDREWRMQDGGDASLLLVMLRRVFDLQEVAS